MINKNIFREYDIRGIYGSELDDGTAYLIGRAFGSNLIKKGLTDTIVGYDNRNSSVSLYNNLVKGILSTGVNIVSLGLVTTPMYYYSWDLLKISCGIMITASHNPKEYNGFKFSYNGKHNAYGTDVMNIYETIINNDFVDGTGQIKSFSIENDYINLLHNSISMGNRSLKVVYDCGNGTTSIIADKVFNKLTNMEMIPLFNISDSNFPNHHPDPCVEENLLHLKNKVIECKADFGIAFDGDGDRVGIVDESGAMIPTDKFMIIVWRDIFNKVNDKRGLFDVKCSKALEDEMIKLGIKPIQYRTGNSYTKAKMVEEKLPFGGELSGHVYFQDKFPGYDDGIYAGLRLIEIMSRTDKKLSELLDGINTYYTTPEIKIGVGDDIKFKVIEKMKEYAISKNYNILTIDGVKILFNDGFALIRASNTGPNITLRFESSSNDKLNQIKEEFSNILDNMIKEIK